MMDALFVNDPKYRPYVRRGRRLHAGTVQRYLGAALRLAERGLRGVARASRRVAAAYMERRRRERAMAELRGLGDKGLQDIGLHRSQIRAAVHGMGDRPEAARPTPARERPKARPELRVVEQRKAA